MHCLAIALCALASHPPVDGVHPEHDPAPTAGDAGPVGILRFEILDAVGTRIPGRLTFIAPDGSDPALFPNTDAAPADFAVRKNVVYTLMGHGAITVPAGRYTVHASRGLEWSIASRPLTVEAGHETIWTPTLIHEVDTTGWVSGDFHLHTLTHSGHGDSNMNERIISLVGEGVEFAVATDHNHNTDYGPTMEALPPSREHLSTITGNEVSTPIGHFNVFPLEPDRRIPEHRIGDAVALFKLFREEPNRYGITPVIQVNHPRWSGAAYFWEKGLDPITGRSDSPEWSPDFDSIELLNENEGWGYYDPDVGAPRELDPTFSVRTDWYNLLNRGHRFAIVGNSDSHTVHYDFCGYPRNFLASPTDDPAAIDPRDIAAAIRAKRTFATIGPFVDFSVNGVAMGGDASATGGSAEVQVRIQAASWIDVDRVMIVVNGDVVQTISVPPERTAVRLDATYPVELRADSWIALLVEGDDRLAPIFNDQGREIRPIAVTNPVWVDADGDGRFTCAWERMTAMVARAGSLDEFMHLLHTPGCNDAEQAIAVVAAARAARPWAAGAVRLALSDSDRPLRLGAARAAESLEDPALLPDLTAAWDSAAPDAHQCVSLLRATAACGGTDIPRRLVDLVRAHRDQLPRFTYDLNPIIPGDFVRDWSVIGFFPDAEGALRSRDFGPEADPDTAASHAGRDGPVTWRPGVAGAEGYLDLRTIDFDPGRLNGVIAYAQAWLDSPDEREVIVTLGSDDGCIAWINGEAFVTDTSDHAAMPLRHVVPIALHKGANRVLIKVRNAGGAFGLYFRVADHEVRAAAQP